eukprot:gene8872-25638_t
MLSETMLLLYLAPMALVGVLGGPAVHHRRHQYKHSQRSAVLISGAAYAPARLATGGGSQQTITTSFACKKWSEVLVLNAREKYKNCDNSSFHAVVDPGSAVTHPGFGLFYAGKAGAEAAKKELYAATLAPDSGASFDYAGHCDAYSDGKAAAKHGKKKSGKKGAQLSFMSKLASKHETTTIATFGAAGFFVVLAAAFVGHKTLSRLHGNGKGGVAVIWPTTPPRPSRSPLRSSRSPSLTSKIAMQRDFVHQEARAGCSTGQSQLLQSLQLSAQTTRERSPPSSKHQDRQSSVASPRVLHFDASEQHQQPHQEHHLQPHLSRTDSTRKVSAVVPPRWKQQNFHCQLQSSNGRHHGPGSSIAGGYLC